MTRALSILLLSALTASALPPNAHYIDFDTGSDSNDGLI